MCVSMVGGKTAASSPNSTLPLSWLDAADLDKKYFSTKLKIVQLGPTMVMNFWGGSCVGLQWNSCISFLPCKHNGAGVFVPAQTKIVVNQEYPY